MDILLKLGYLSFFVPEHAFIIHFIATLTDCIENNSEQFCIFCLPPSRVGLELRTEAVKMLNLWR